MYIVQSSPKQATQPSREAVTAADFGPSWQTKVELGLLSCSLPQLSSARSLAQRSQSARYIAYLLVSHKTELFVPHAKFVTKYGQNLFLAVFPFLVTYYAGITKKNIFGTTFLIGSNDFKLFGLASSLVSLMYVCGRVPRQLQNSAYIPSYHDIGKLWRGSVGMTESKGSELVRWQRKATVVTYTAKGFQASIWS
jgi:hypothetical protein